MTNLIKLLWLDLRCIIIIFLQRILLVNFLNIPQILKIMIELSKLTFRMKERWQLRIRILRLVFHAADLIGEKFLVFLNIEFIEFKTILLLFSLYYLFLMLRYLVRFIRIDIKIFNEFVLPTASLWIRFLSNSFFVCFNIKIKLFIKTF